MPSYEMPLEEMKEYRGSSPCPKDFDTYWSDALAELDAVKPEPILKPAAFQAAGTECFDLYFKGVRGAKIHAKLLMPQHSAGKSPALLQFHGYTGSAGPWSEKLGYSGAGFVVAALDCRGQGGSSQDTGGVLGTTMQGHIVRGLSDEPENLLMRHIFLDTVQLARIIMEMPQVDAQRVSVMGGSQGGGLSLACAGLKPRIAKAAVDYPFLCDYKRVWQMNRTVQGAYSELRCYFRDFDPLHQREDEIFEHLGYIDVQNLASRIRARTLMAIPLMDEVCPPSTQFAAYNRISAPKRLCIYPDWGHEYIPRHADIVFGFLNDWP